MRAYFVDRLHLGLVYRRLIRARAAAQPLDAAPGLAEMFFIGQLWWLTTLAEREAQIRVAAERAPLAAVDQRFSRWRSARSESVFAMCRGSHQPRRA